MVRAKHLRIKIMISPINLGANASPLQLKEETNGSAALWFAQQIANFKLEEVGG